MGGEFSVQILGSNSALPFNNRFPSAQYLKYGKHSFLVDAGEGCQFRLQEYKLSAYALDAVFITHLHGDHIFGLPGILTSLSLNRRSRKLDVFSPPGLKSIIHTIVEVSGSKLSFPIDFHEVDCTQYRLVYSLPYFDVFSVPLDHRVPTSGYLFREKVIEYNIDKERLQQSDIPVSALPKLKKGQDVKLKDGRILKYKDFTLPKKPARAYAYLTDTRYVPHQADKVSGVDLLYHDSTFIHAAEEKAEKTGHSTAFQAAKFAFNAKAGKLLLGHFSSRYQDLDPLLEEARAVFPATELAVDGTVWQVGE